MAKEPATIVREVFSKATGAKTATLYSDGTIMIYGIRGSYCHLDAPYKGKNPKPGDIAKYSMVGLMPKKSHVEAKDLIKAEMDRVMRENKVEDLPADKKFLRNGDLAGKPEYKDMWSISAREERKPHIRDRNGVKVAPEDVKSQFQSGYWYNMLIRPWWQPDKGYGRRVNSGLMAVQFVRTDETFGEGGIDDEDVDARFGAIDNDDAGFAGSDDSGLDDL